MPLLGNLRAATRRFEDSLRRRRVGEKFFGGAPGARYQLAAAVRTPTAEDAFGARDAECALERADSRIAGIRSEVLVATLTVRAQLKHGGLHWLEPQARRQAPSRRPTCRTGPSQFRTNTSAFKSKPSRALLRAHRCAFHRNCLTARWLVSTLHSLLAHACVAPEPQNQRALER